MHRIQRPAVKRTTIEEVEASRQFMDTFLSELERQGVRKASLARRLGISRKNLSTALQGGRNIELYTMARWAKALGCELEIKLVAKTTIKGDT
jgi:transcriptional regulator with XRE-family HTH domain